MTGAPGEGFVYKKTRINGNQIQLRAVRTRLPQLQKVLRDTPNDASCFLAGHRHGPQRFGDAPVERDIRVGRARTRRVLCRERRVRFGDVADAPKAPFRTLSLDPPMILPLVLAVSTRRVGCRWLRCPERPVRDSGDVLNGPFGTLTVSNGPFATSAMSPTRRSRQCPRCAPGPRSGLHPRRPPPDRRHQPARSSVDRGSTSAMRHSRHGPMTRGDPSRR
jgi:hypothetical protein